MELNKSSRHSKITGDFAEHLILYWLSKYGFECARVDHTGIDIIAKSPHTHELMGISVKGRSRNLGKEGEHMAIRNDHFEKVEAACTAFGCVPYFAIVIDEETKIYAFILSMAELLQMFPRGSRVSAWKMTAQHLARYRQNPNIVMFEFSHSIHQWFAGTAPSRGLQPAEFDEDEIE
jgi:Holliday junction resolvase-like predicted endonuclease